MDPSPRTEVTKCRYCDFQASPAQDVRTQMEIHCKQAHPDEWNHMVDSFLTEIGYKKNPLQK